MFCKLSPLEFTKLANFTSPLLPCRLVFTFKISLDQGRLHNLRSPYLLGICAYMLLYSITSTVLYFQQVGIAASAFTNRPARTAFFAQIDLLVNVLTILCQAFLTGRLLKWLGVGVTLAILPALSVLGFTAMGIT